MHRVVRRRVAAALLLIAAFAFLPALAKPGHGREAANENPGIVPPNAKFGGKSYSEWAAEFWQWAFSLPVEGHPFLDDSTEFDLSANQPDGPVWFWAAPDGPLTRHATIPAGKALFLTLRDVDASSLEEPPFFGATEEEQREIANFFADHIVDVFATIDGVPVENLEKYRFETDQFEFSAPSPWVFGANGGQGTAVGDGYFLLIPPLPKGQHTIHYGGTFRFEAGELGEEPLEFVKEITIELTVE